MTQDAHLELYKEINSVLYNRTKNFNSMSQAQQYFVKAFESAVFGSSFLECYSDLVDFEPDINIRNLHAFCIGHSLGLKMSQFEYKDHSNETH